MRLKKQITNNNHENIFWITMTDLMTALVLVFVVLFIYTYFTNIKQEIIQKINEQKSTEYLQKELKNNNIEASVDSLGLVKISNLELFELNSYKLSDKGKKYLAKFSPVYLNSIFTNDYLKENIEYIIIQGHTDSQQYIGISNEDEQYMKNMDLSLKRAYEVANFMINCPYNKENGNKLRRMIIVEGASFSQPIITKGKENFEKSRRVELKLIMKNANNIQTDDFFNSNL